jgi:hypothetical protein
MPAYPNGQWSFNPFAWQLLFVFGAWCALGGGRRIADLVRSDVLLAVAAVYLLFAFAITMTWYFPRLAHFVPRWLADFMYPIDKADLDVLRFAHFLALAILTVRFVPSDWPPLKWPWLWPVIICGQHSLEIFCLGVFLAFAGHFIFIEISDRVPMQLLVSVSGIAAMVAVAALITWYKDVEGRGSAAGPENPDADLAGGHA